MAIEESNLNSKDVSERSEAPETNRGAMAEVNNVRSETGRFSADNFNSDSKSAGLPSLEISNNANNSRGGDRAPGVNNGSDVERKNQTGNNIHGDPKNDVDLGKTNGIGPDGNVSRQGVDSPVSVAKTQENPVQNENSKKGNSPESDPVNGTAQEKQYNRDAANNNNSPGDMRSSNPGLPDPNNFFQNLRLPGSADSRLALNTLNGLSNLTPQQINDFEYSINNALWRNGARNQLVYNPADGWSLKPLPFGRWPIGGPRKRH